MLHTVVTGKSGREFKITEEIGSGSFGAVYQASDLKTGEICAVKVISSATEDGIASFNQEIESSRTIFHENVLPVLDYGEKTIGKTKLLFVVTPFCGGGDYRARLEKRGTPRGDVEVVVAEMRQVLQGLAALHGRIIHRDIKPENVLIDGKTLRIADYGLAKFVDDATRTITFKGSGTPLYMAPEVWTLQKIERSADLYSVGVMFHEALSGTPPFEAGDINRLRDHHLYTPAPRINNPDVPAPLAAIVKKLLTKEPRSRYQSAGEVIAGLDALQMSGPSKHPELVNRIRQQHDREESIRLAAEQDQLRIRDVISRNRYKEEELIQLIDEVVQEINSELIETKIRLNNGPHNRRSYVLGNRVLAVTFFSSHPLFGGGIPEWAEAVLRRGGAVHGGYIEITESSQDRQGWNFALIRKADDMYGEWHIVESDMSPLTGKALRFPPVATLAPLFAENLAHHWGHAMHTWVLKEKTLERADIVKILDKFISPSL